MVSRIKIRGEDRRRRAEGGEKKEERRRRRAEREANRRGRLDRITRTADSRQWARRGSRISDMSRRRKARGEDEGFERRRRRSAQLELVPS